MTSRRARVDLVHRVRQAQELQAAGAMAQAAAAGRRAEATLADLHARYDTQRVRDLGNGTVPRRLADRAARTLQAQAIQRARLDVRQTLAVVEERRADLTQRTTAVRAMERLQERLAIEHAAEEQRAERRELEARPFSPTSAIEVGS